MTRNPDTLRRLLLALVLFGAVGLEADLLLLEHYDSVWKWAPLAVLGVAIGAGTAAWWWPTRRIVTLFRVMMAVCVAAGLAGVVLHFKGNMEFALERDPALSGFALLWKVLRGATPSLAPGALAQLGLLRLLFTYRHPALERGDHPDPEST